jgi:FkbM family methyltransferase
MKCAALGLRFFPPNYAFFDDIRQNSVAIDVGVGDNPDFSLLLMNNYHIECFMVDPTQKHRSKLEAFAKQHSMAHYLPFALGPKNESRTFYESRLNVSGSLQKEHVNVRNDPIDTYEVQVITLSELLQKSGNKPIAIMKVDVEGEEYEFVRSLSNHDLQKIDQLIIEFHHDTVKTYSKADTFQAIKLIECFGMKSILYNGRDCLFYWGK